MFCFPTHRMGCREKLFTVIMLVFNLFAFASAASFAVLWYILRDDVWIGWFMCAVTIGAFGDLLAFLGHACAFYDSNKIEPLEDPPEKIP